MLERIASHLFGIEPTFGLGGDTGLLLLWGVGHCDTTDGPVVTLAKKALGEKNVNLVLPWVRAEDEHEIRHAVDHAQAVRDLGPAILAADRTLSADELPKRVVFVTVPAPALAAGAKRAGAERNELALAAVCSVASLRERGLRLGREAVHACNFVAIAAAADASATQDGNRCNRSGRGAARARKGRPLSRGRKH